MRLIPLHRLAATSVLAVLAHSICDPAPARAGVDWREWSREDKTIALNLGAAAGLLAWGVGTWDYGDKSPRFSDEGWFGRETNHGGADKLGHFWTGYALSHLFAGQYERWDYTPDEAARLGAVSSLGAMSLVEIGDAFSEHGFSYQDFLFDAVGAGIGYLWWTNPDLARKFDFRVEYDPFRDGELQGDVFTDYDRLKYLVAIKAEGFEGIDNPVLKLLELHVGWYSRGYEAWDPLFPERDERRRYFYVGIGINLTRLLQPTVKTNAFNYLQVPYTDLTVRAGVD
ncbi:MAG TPA: DUF2279 domain-containing protein [Azospirillaceae bacterium]|nr:DUF2279 domain-containing protein [Azospirillaceae bacterium]